MLVEQADSRVRVGVDAGMDRYMPAIAVKKKADLLLKRKLPFSNYV
jgi:hypothetical protein